MSKDNKIIEICEESNYEDSGIDRDGQDVKEKRCTESSITISDENIKIHLKKHEDSSSTTQFISSSLGISQQTLFTVTPGARVRNTNKKTPAIEKESSVKKILKRGKITPSGPRSLDESYFVTPGKLTSEKLAANQCAAQKELDKVRKSELGLFREQKGDFEQSKLPQVENKTLKKGTRDKAHSKKRAEKKSRYQSPSLYPYQPSDAPDAAPVLVVRAEEETLESRKQRKIMPSLEGFFVSPRSDPASAFVTRTEHDELDMRLLPNHVRPPEDSPLMWGDSCSRGVWDLGEQSKAVPNVARRRRKRTYKKKKKKSKDEVVDSEEKDNFQDTRGDD
mmetsp:Transcript_25483/g.39448  ORF Transcript_25483/g.39448 Transcript_25483/m.39448 type:complete len:335 (+) Transcript_25483:126-1130(+)